MTTIRVSPNGVHHLVFRNCATCGNGPHREWPQPEGNIMDPDATLNELRALLANLEAFTGGPPVARGSMADARRIAARIQDLFGALDEWLSRGGFKPAAWNTAPVTVDRQPQTEPRGDAPEFVRPEVAYYFPRGQQS
jgi:hypothetical protein